MNKFLPVVTVAALIGLGLVLFTGLSLADDEITFTDLETECQVDDQAESHFELRQDNTIRFDGHYPIANPNSELSYSFTQSDNLIRLEIEDTGLEEPEDFEHDCLASVVYDAETEQIDHGTYFLEVFHSGEQVTRNIIQVR